MLNELIYRCMGNLKYFSLLIAAGMFAACSDNLENAGNVNEGPKTGEGYVKVAINLPSVSSSRAAGDYQFADGSKDEFAVTGGIIAFFESSTGNEADAGFVKAYDLGDLTGKQQDQNQNGQVSTKVAQILEAPLPISETNQMYALVILNPNSVATVNSADGSLILKNGTTNNITLTSGSKISALNNDVEWNLDVTGITGKNGFLMLNSPLYNNNNSTTQTLVPVEVYATEQLAAVGKTAQIYVERIVAKVDVVAPSEYIIDEEGNTYNGDKVTFMEKPNDDKLGWVLNVTNKNTNPLRNVSDIAKWVGNTSVRSFVVNGSEATLDGSWRRIHWAKDNNYNVETTPTDDFTIYDSKSNPESIAWKGYSSSSVSAPQYCLENTDIYKYNRENNTTSVLIRAKYDYNPGEADDKSFFIVDKVSDTKPESDFISYIKTELGITDNPVLSINADADGGYYTGAEQLKTLITGLNGDTYDDKLNAIGEVRYYKDGGCYYYTEPIKHFGQEYTAGEDKNQDKYFGRFGVVRNNWYYLTINSVSGPGLPAIPDEGTDHVDDEEGYIKCTINVLSWAKRSQGVDL